MVRIGEPCREYIREPAPHPVEPFEAPLGDPADPFEDPAEEPIEPAPERVPVGPDGEPLEEEEEIKDYCGGQDGGTQSWPDRLRGAAL